MSERKKDGRLEGSPFLGLCSMQPSSVYVVTLEIGVRTESLSVKFWQGNGVPRPGSFCLTGSKAKR